MRFADFKVVLRQAAAWTEEFDPGTRQIMGLATEEWATIFDGDPVILPPGPGLPPEIPRVTIRSNDRQWRLQVASNRLDVFWEGQTGLPVLDADDFTQAVVGTIRAYSELSERIRFMRMAYVVRRLAESESPSRELAAHFCRAELLEGPLKRPEHFELHAHKKYMPAELPEVNSWVRWTTARIADADIPVLSVLQDLNTLAEDTPERRYTMDDIGRFYQRAPGETDEILRLYLGQ